MTVLVTGGAGYIGSHVCRLLHERGERVVVVDDLSSGDASRTRARLEVLDLASPDATSRLIDIIRFNDVTSAIHLAALKDVGESMDDPERYYRVNLAGLGNLLAALRATDVRDLVFSSSAAVYGDTQQLVVDERTPCAPANPYGETKLVGEWMLAAARRAWGLRAVSLRYFNVAGAGWPDLRDTVAKNLIPIVIDLVRKGAHPRVFGADHDTDDGTCVRDYVHVLDLAGAHLHALDALGSGTLDVETINIGTGSGASVLEVIDAVRRVSEQTVVPEIVAARAGDPAAVVADTTLAGDRLGWTAEFGLDDIVRSAWTESAKGA
ncbi:UDP-glucose 4-epimerase GalE [Leifsonia sp. Le1]|uniref:UDP-glucose 4-epimerase GalE n=1 Tax=Leifsonia sp. Le1 TaxID=3404918 RepID=UPI003EC08957